VSVVGLFELLWGGEVEQAVQPVVVVPVGVVQGDGFDVGEGAQWAGAKREEVLPAAITA
jgi:hypothetical protein